MAKNSTLRRLAATTAVALAFAPMAQAGGLLDSDAATLRYRGEFSNALASVADKNDEPRTRARGFMVELEKALKAPTEKTQTVVYPKDNSTNMLVVAAVVPPKGLEALPIPVCAQQHNKVMGTWNITSKGEVIPRPIIVNPEGSTKAACNAFIAAARAEINAQMAQAPANPPASPTAQPPPTTVATVAAMAAARP